LSLTVLAYCIRYQYSTNPKHTIKLAACNTMKNAVFAKPEALAAASFKIQVFWMGVY
jgi:hypothetical protein